MKCFDDVVQYGNIDEIEGEIQNWVNMWKSVPIGERPKKILDVLNSQYIQNFPSIQVVLEVFVILPVTTASVERGFSEMRILKSWLRSTMKDKRLSYLALMHFMYDQKVPYMNLLA